MSTCVLHTPAAVQRCELESEAKAKREQVDREVQRQLPSATATLVGVSTLPEIPAADEQAILVRTRELQEVHARGDDAAANTLLAGLADDYGTDSIAAVMAVRDEREQLGVEAELLRLLGPRHLYGEH